MDDPGTSNSSRGRWEHPQQTMINKLDLKNFFLLLRTTSKSRKLSRIGIYIYIYIYLQHRCRLLINKYCRIYLQNTVAESTCKNYIIFCTTCLPTLVKYISMLEGLNKIFFLLYYYRDFYSPVLRLFINGSLNAVKLRIYTSVIKTIFEKPGSLTKWNDMHLKRLYQTVNKVMCHWINRTYLVLPHWYSLYGSIRGA